jgi:N-acetylneuraminate synthase
LGVIRYGATDAEKKSLVFRRSLYISKDIKKGKVLSPENLRCVRPGLGLAPKFYDQVIGLKVNIDVVKGTPLTWELLLENR